jgi:hypothetical protein
LNKAQKKKHKKSKRLEHIFRACDFSQVHLALCPNPTPSTNFQIKLGYIMEITLVPLLPIWVLDDVVLGRIFGPVTAPCNLLPSQDQGSITSISYRTQLSCR